MSKEQRYFKQVIEDLSPLVIDKHNLDRIRNHLESNYGPFDIIHIMELVESLPEPVSTILDPVYNLLEDTLDVLANQDSAANYHEAYMEW